MASIKSGLTTVLSRIQAAEQKYGRPPGSVQLLAVSKAHPVSAIQEAVNSGQGAFGESYLQEALDKIGLLSDLTLEWHFIGSLQSNKTRPIAENFSWVHGISSVKIARRLSEQRPQHLPALNLCLQVNISQEPSKSGISPEETLTLAKEIITLPNIKLRGLMAIPAPVEDFEQQRAPFRKLRELKDQLCAQGLALDTLSMGMSDDMEAAIAEGATIVRIGTDIFGRRK